MLLGSDNINTSSIKQFLFIFNVKRKTTKITDVYNFKMQPNLHKYYIFNSKNTWQTIILVC